MKTLSLIAFAALFTSTSFAQIGPTIQTARQDVVYASGRGTDEATVLIGIDPLGSDRARFNVTYNYVSRQATTVRLPPIRMTRTCGLRRASGGSLGDYKPKNINDILWVGSSGTGSIIFRNYEYGRDTNEVPTVRYYTVANGNQLSESAKQYLTGLCFRGASNVSLTWTGHGDCRWKPENWFKPGDFPFEYRGPMAKVSFSVPLTCTNR